MRKFKYIVKWLCRCVDPSTLERQDATTMFSISSSDLLSMVDEYAFVKKPWVCRFFSFEIWLFIRSSEAVITDQIASVRDALPIGDWSSSELSEEL